jgi:ComF family protein
MVHVGQLWELVLNLLYPPQCCACGQATDRPEFCRRCCAQIEAPHTPLCSICGVPFRTHGDTDHPCSRCLDRPPRFRRARACAIYDAADSVTHPLKTVLQRYKYGRDVTLVRPLARLLTERSPLVLADYDLIVPVPLHLDRLRWRGFNQSQFLAHALARGSGIRVDAFSLQRMHATRPQVQLREADRRHNVRHAFRVARPGHVHGRRLLLVDDVYTTGATADECSRVLRRAGARSVDVLVLARAVLH